MFNKKNILIEKTVSGQWKKIFFYGIFFCASIILIMVASVFFYFLIHRTEINKSLDEYKLFLYGKGKFVRNPTIKIYSMNNALIGEYSSERNSRITMNRCNKMKWMRASAVSAEDRFFFEHKGISFRAIFRAFINNLKSFSIREGGGTITQQLARNLFTDGAAPALLRKIYETFVAFQIEGLYSKDEILCLYLNKIYMGEGRFGAEEAARLYFNIPPENLSAAEAAMIAGLFPSPMRYSPLNNARLAFKKQELVFAALIRDGKIEKKNKKKLIKMFLKKYGAHSGPDTASAGKIGMHGASRGFRRNAAPAANQYVRQFLREILDEEVIRKGGLKVYTTIDYLRQRAAEEAVRLRIRTIRQKFIKKIPNSSKQRLQIAKRFNGVLVAMDARNGNIRAVVGGYRIAEGGIMKHRAWKMKRQVGSALKGFLYAVALDEKVLHLDSVLLDEPLNYAGYSPRNWYNKFLGPISLRKAVALSVNTVAVSTLKKVGVSLFRDRLIAALNLDYLSARNRFPANLSLALGTGEMTPVELASVYAVLLNRGRVVQPDLVIKIEDETGTEIWQNPEEKQEEQKQLLSPESCAAAIELLRSTFDEKFDGTMKRFGRRQLKNFGYLPFPIAGKSGTVETVPRVARKYPGLKGVHDAWFVGMVPDEVAVIWIGHDEGAPFPGSGSGSAGTTWVDYARKALPGTVHGKFPTVEKKIEEIKEKEPEKEENSSKPVG